MPPQGDTIAGYFIPGGTALGMNTASLTRSRVHFGDDADLFRPERFEEVDAAARAERERLVELVFGHGRWMCAGKPVAFMELNKALFEVSARPPPGPLVWHWWGVIKGGARRHSADPLSSSFALSTSSWQTQPSRGIPSATVSS